MVHNKCTFSDKQWIKLQETPDAIPEGETPHTGTSSNSPWSLLAVSLYAFDDLVDISRPGRTIVNFTDIKRRSS
jgi:DNA replication licensing factor MCM4